VRPIDIGTRGYLDSPLSIATMGHLNIELIILKPTSKSGFARKMSDVITSEIERKVYLKRNPKLLREEDEIILIMQSFLICQS
jgi:hypothetical protein